MLRFVMIALAALLLASTASAQIAWEEACTRSQRQGPNWDNAAEGGATGYYDGYWIMKDCSGNFTFFSENLVAAHDRMKVVDQIINDLTHGMSAEGGKLLVSGNGGARMIATKWIPTESKASPLIGTLDEPPFISSTGAHCSTPEPGVCEPILMCTSSNANTAAPGVKVDGATTCLTAPNSFNATERQHVVAHYGGIAGNPPIATWPYALYTFLKDQSGDVVATFVFKPEQLSRWWPKWDNLFANHPVIGVDPGAFTVSTPDLPIGTTPQSSAFLNTASENDIRQTVFVNEADQLDLNGDGWVGFYEQSVWNSVFGKLVSDPTNGPVHLVP